MQNLIYSVIGIYWMAWGYHGITMRGMNMFVFFIGILAFSVGMIMFCNHIDIYISEKIREFKE